MHKNRYLEFSDFAHIKPYPVNEFKICKLATFLAQKMKTVESIERYVSTICDENEMKGFRPVRKGIKYYRAINGIKRSLHHKVKRVEPMTTKLLHKIRKAVNMNDQKDMVVWVTMISGFFMVLWKSNLVPLSQVHDMVHNICRSDVRYHKGVMVIIIRWSKTNQHGEKETEIPLVVHKGSEMCPVKWILHMVKTIPAKSNMNLFSYMHKKKGVVVPVTYRDLMETMRKWLDMIGVNSLKYSSHSLCRGATTHVYKSNIAETSIMRMEFWWLQCFRRYIKDDVETRIKAWFQMANIKK